MDKKFPALAIAMAFGIGITGTASADIELIAIGSINGHYEDLAFDSAVTLENGNRGNPLGGLGSGLAYAGGNRFLALPDRGPNAQPYDSNIDDTTSYIPRAQSLSLSLVPSPAGSALPYVLSAHLTDTTLLSSRTPLAYGPQQPALNAAHHRFYFSGRSDNFDASKTSLNDRNGRLDPEGIRVARDGESFFITDEYGPYVYQFDRRSGVRLRAYALPEKFAATNLNAKGDVEIAGNSSGRIANKGMEGLAITPDGRLLVGIMQSPLAQDGGTSAAYTRIVIIDVRTGRTREYAYELNNIGSVSKPKYPTVSEIVAINDHEFLVDERDGKGLGDNSVAAYKRLYKIDLNGATEVSTLSGAANLAGKTVSKTAFLDLVAALTAAGINSADIPAKIEGLAFGPDLAINGVTKRTLFVANDNDFIGTVVDSLHPNGIDNPNRFFVFAIDDADLPGFVAQSFLERRHFAD